MESLSSQVWKAYLSGEQDIQALAEKFNTSKGNIKGIIKFRKRSSEKYSRSCMGKIGFDNQTEANAAIDALSSQTDTKAPDVNLNSYHCNFCNKWHIGHTPLRLRINSST